MNYTSLKELYLSVIPAFNVKKRLLKYQDNDITNEKIWSYLVETKWKFASNLTISDIVNDIINCDISNIK